eukprot:m.77090 g.77090  ORF g.77090 m.77090 type:complete len:89 (+) comp36009_c0_seq3:498-764(+)
MVVFSGGRSGTDPVSDQQLHLMHADAGEWKQPVTRGAPPSPRHGHVLVSVGRMVYVHGGMAGSNLHQDLHAINLGKFNLHYKTLSFLH